MSTPIDKTRDEMEHELTERDMDCGDSDVIYDTYRYGCVGYSNYSDGELESYYNDSFQYDGDTYKLKKPITDWDERVNV